MVQTVARSSHDAPTTDLGPPERAAGHVAGRPLPTGPGRYLVVESGAADRTLALADEVVHVGRGLRCQLRLDERSVSRRHALLVHRPGGHRVLDDRSANGTWVNGRAVSEADLADGDVLRIGGVVLRYVVVD
ncbi:MAG TPA: FHA domain-containing protein [Solirubrobacteraceae bacterium]|jgi:pSer/pThr/pTyr-binding forkhead associated (FHA) protein|nr:FHA domain-containing protein [Solirubrobacteraceae bacterium]